MDLRGKIKSAAVQIIRRLQDSGYEAYVVGGAIRDLLLNCVPKDYDIATNATPEEVREVFGRRQCMVIGRRFRLAQVRMGDDVYEVSTFRRTPTAAERRMREGDDGQMIWNDNEYGTLEEDMRRRDFTVNAMYFNPLGDGEIIDGVGGQRDLESRVVRVIGDAKVRFVEDPVRMLRALKLAGMHGFSLSDDVAQALHEKRGMIQRASITRLYEELLKIFMTGHSLSIFTAFHAHGFLDCFWPSLEEIWEEPCGRMCRCLLLARDRAMVRGGYSKSKALALATISFPFVMQELERLADEEGIGEDHEDWTHVEGMGSACMELLRGFFDGFVLPRFYSLRVKEILLMIPSLCSEGIAYRYFKHREYKYGRQLVKLLVDGLDWDTSLYDVLPEPGVPVPRRHRRIRHRKRVVEA